MEYAQPAKTRARPPSIGTALTIEARWTFSTTDAVPARCWHKPQLSVTSKIHRQNGVSVFHRHHDVPYGERPLEGPRSISTDPEGNRRFYARQVTARLHGDTGSIALRRHSSISFVSVVKSGGPSWTTPFIITLGCLFNNSIPPNGVQLNCHGLQASFFECTRACKREN